MSGKASPFRSAALAAALALAWLGALPAAQADDRGRGRGGDRGDERRWVQQADRREPWDRPPQEHPGRGAPPPVYVQPPVYAQPPRQLQPPPQWQGRGGERAERRWNPRAPRLRPGDQLPPEYRQRQFVVNDWRAHRLYAPPPGHQWVQPEPGNYILIGRNGEIVNMLVGQ